MPIYDFECGQCGHQQEVMRKVSAANVELCPQCQQMTFTKKVSAPHFQLTGSGWYATDFKQKPPAQPSPSVEPAASASASSACAPGCACH